MLIRPAETTGQFPDIGAFLIAAHQPDFTRSPLGEPTFEELAYSIAGNSGPIPEEYLRAMTRMGLMLDVGCGYQFGETRPGCYCTPVGTLPGAYGIDPMLYTQKGITGKTVAGIAEDMPFRDETFDWTFSSRSVGWYAGSMIDPDWAVAEMVRVTKAGGLVTINLGASGRTHAADNIRLIRAAANKMAGINSRVEKVLDYSSMGSTPQIAISLRE